MNTGSKNAQSVGFDISYLPKLSNTKDRENKATLLHFLVEYVERDYPDLLSFADEMFHMDGASRISVETIQKSLKQMDSSIKNLEMDLKNAARAPAEKDDRFSEAMGAFCQQAREQCDILNAMAQKMEKLYADLADYFVFDKQKYSLEEFMTDIKTFKDQFKVIFVYWWPTETHKNMNLPYSIRMHTVKNPKLLRHPLKIDNLIFALLSNFMKQYSRIYLLGPFSEKCIQIFLKTKQERTIKI